MKLVYIIEDTASFVKNDEGFIFADFSLDNEK